MKQNAALSILTPFSSKSAKKWEGADQKPEIGWGVSENCYLCYYFSFVPFFTSVEADMYVFQVKESILKGFEKILYFVFPKNVVLCHRPRGRFCGCARNRLQFWCFVKAEWNINHTEGYWKFEQLIPFCMVVAPIYLQSERSPLKYVGTKVHWPLCKPMVQFCVILMWLPRPNK